MKINKKIAVICNYRLIPDRVGGMDRFFWLFDSECKRLGHEVIWFFPNAAQHGDYNNLTIISANDKPLESFFLSYSIQNQSQFGVVVTHFLELCTSFFKKVKKQQVSKTIAVDHNPRPLQGYGIKKKAIKRIKGILYARYTDVFVGVSNYTRNHIFNDFGSHLKNKTVVIYNGILQELFEKRTQRNTMHPTFLVACHLRYSKGIQDLIEAVALLPLDIKEKIQIAVYGEGDYESNLKKQIENKQLNVIFEFKGSVSNLYEVYCQYDYLLQPTHMECFSLSILESLGANVPVITTSVGGNEEVIKNGVNGYIFPPQDIKALAAILENVFTGSSAITQNTATLIASEFSMEKMVQQHINLLN